MGKTAFTMLWAAVWVTVAAAAALSDNDQQKLPGQRFFRTLPEDYQPDYLTFELSRGYSEKISIISRNDVVDEPVVFPDGLDIPEDLVQRFKALEVPDNFTENLFDFVQAEFNLDQSGIRTLILTRGICFENGICIDINDIGSLCCPF